MQGFLKPLHTNHVSGQCESLALVLKAELPTKINTVTSNLGPKVLLFMFFFYCDIISCLVSWLIIPITDTCVP